MNRKSQRKATNRAKQLAAAEPNAREPSMENKRRKKKKVSRSWDSITHPEALRIGGRPLLPHRSPRAGRGPRPAPNRRRRATRLHCKGTASVRASAAEAGEGGGRGSGGEPSRLAAVDGDGRTPSRYCCWVGDAEARGERREKSGGLGVALFILRGMGAFPRGRATPRPTPGR